MTDEQIIQSLPPGLQGDLKEFGPLETKQPDEIHQFMLDMREKHNLPPWNAFTELMKHAASAAGMGSGITSENMWYRVFAKTECNINDNDPGWCLLKVTATSKDGSKQATGRYAVHPAKNLIWSLQTETMVNGPTVTCHKKGVYQRGVKRSVLLNTAKKLIQTNQRSGEITDVATRVLKRRAKASACKQAEPEPMEQMTVQQREIPLFATQTAEQQKSALTDLQRSTMLIVFELGAAKARELGMHSTIARWRTELAPVIGPEVHHVND